MAVSYQEILALAEGTSVLSEEQKEKIRRVGKIMTPAQLEQLKEHILRAREAEFESLKEPMAVAEFLMKREKAIDEDAMHAEAKEQGAEDKAAAEKMLKKHLNANNG